METKSSAPSSPTRRELLSLGAATAAGASLAACAAPAVGASPRDPLDELFADLTDQSASVEPIRDGERSARRLRLATLLAERDLGALLVEPGPTLTWLTGVSWGKSERFFGLLCGADHTATWIVPAFEESRARARIDTAAITGGEVLAWQEDEPPWRAIAARLSERRLARVALEPALRVVFAERLAAEVGEARIARGAGSELVLALRGRKDAHEIRILRRANELTQVALCAVAREVRAGTSGSEIGAMVERAHARLGFSSSWNLSLIGPAAALPHGEPDQRKIARGDVLLIDAGGSLHGYQSDETRTWVFDAPPSAEVERAWNAVRDAQRRAFDAVRPGVVCGDVDRAARATIVERGFEGGYRAFTHRLGHGIGLEGHEDPYFDGGSRVVLASGMTLTDEPGVYFPGKFGIRLEDVLLVTETGADHFGSWQASATSPA